MGLPRSTYYDTPATEADTEIVARITAICEEFEAYGYRRVGAALRHQGIVVNGKKIRRLMRQHDLQPKRRRRFIATTDSDHDSPIFSNRARTLRPTGRTSSGSQTSPTSRSPLVSFMPPSSLIHGPARPSDGELPPKLWTSACRPVKLNVLRRPVEPAQYAAADHRKLLAKHGLIGSMSRRGNPYENAMAERPFRKGQGRRVILSGHRGRTPIRGQASKPIDTGMRWPGRRRLHRACQGHLHRLLEPQLCNARRECLGRARTEA